MDVSLYVFFGVVSGVFKFFIFNVDGDEVIFMLVELGNWFGGVLMFD